MKRRSSLPLLVLVALLALVVGSAGTAVAGPALTKGKVTKIAAKVVHKLAPTLSVATATTATNATNLDGQPASAYRTGAFTVPLANATSVSTINRTLPQIPAGTYQISIYLNATTSSGSAPLYCSLYQDGNSVQLIDAYAAQYSFGRTLQASRIITLPANAGLHLACTVSTGTFTIPADPTYAPAQLQFLRVDDLTTLAAAKPSASSQ